MQPGVGVVFPVLAAATSPLLIFAGSNIPLPDIQELFTASSADVISLCCVVGFAPDMHRWHKSRVRSLSKPVNNTVAVLAVTACLIWSTTGSGLFYEYPKNNPEEKRSE